MTKILTYSTNSSTHYLNQWSMELYSDKSWFNQSKGEEMSLNAPQTHNIWTLINMLRPYSLSAHLFTLHLSERPSSSHEVEKIKVSSCLHCRRSSSVISCLAPDWKGKLLMLTRSTGRSITTQLSGSLLPLLNTGICVIISRSANHDMHDSSGIRERQ